jgi:serine/threonine-protein kinase
MSERKTVKGFFEFLISSEVARLVVETGAIAAVGPAGVAIPVAGRAIEYYGPAVIQRMWTYISGRPKAEAALLLEEVANLDARSAWELAGNAARTNPGLKEASEASREHLGAVLAAIPTGFRQMLPRDQSGHTTCPADALPRNEVELLQSFPLAVPPYVPPCGLPGTQYRLEEIIGTGGFGTVYRARLETEDVPRAIKVASDPNRTASLRNERNSLKRLIDRGGAWSDRVVRLYGERLDSEPPFLIYEYVAGGDLAQFVRDRRRANGRDLNADEALSIVREIAECLAVPHSVGMAHRDLKPTNLLLNRRGWKLADFGLGAAVDPRGSAAERRTSLALSQELRGSGTPLYMCEEQRRGDAASPRHDVYSLGVLWYQLLMGDFTQRLTPDWEESLRERRVPENHVALIGRCVRGFKNRPEDGKSLVQDIDAIAHRSDEVRRRQLAEREAERKRSEREQAERSRRRAENTAWLLRRAGIALMSGGLGAIALGALGWLVGYLGWAMIVVAFMLFVFIVVVSMGWNDRRKRTAAVGFGLIIPLFSLLLALEDKVTAAQFAAMLDGGRAGTFGLVASVVGAVAGLVAGVVILARRG